MPDLKINGTTYAGVAEVQIPLADDSGNARFVHEGTVVNGKLLCTLESEMNLKDIIAAHPIPREYEKSLVWIKITGDNIASQGSETVNWLMIYCENTEIETVNTTKRSASFNYTNGLQSPNSMPMFKLTYVKTSNFITLASDGSITGLNTTSYVAAGNSISYLEIPFDYYNFLLNPYPLS